MKVTFFFFTLTAFAAVVKKLFTMNTKDLQDHSLMHAYLHYGDTAHDNDEA